ncbi:Major Facilitator Superfamily protein [Butyrivibrio sp. ob235]|nr:MFS transporter [Butyrivibrio sp. ob235]SEL70525.1 Major Facilitator Superfamily protein [Butyrivibrio sp. ob235]
MAGKYGVVNMEKKSNFRKFLLLWAGELISSVGGGLTSFGLGVYIFRQTGSAGSMAMVTLLGFLPTLLLSVPAGALADRYDRRLLMMIGDGCSALGVACILFCMMRGEASLLQICIGVFASACFSALLEPSFRATITDLLTKEEFSKASGLVSLAGSARYLLSPIIAGFLLSISDVKLLLGIDICTFFLTVISAAVVRHGIGAKEIEKKEPLLQSVKEGWNILCEKRGVLTLVAISSVITLFMGVLQILAEPLILSIADAKTLGVSETVCACGMLVSGVFLGIKGIKGYYVKTLGIALIFAGVFMFGFGLWENIFIICIFGFLFFATLPFANNCLDYLVRTNVPDGAQGRVWGLIGFISQIGYVVAYGVSGTAADLLGQIDGRGVGRGAALVILIAGVCLSLASVSVLMSGDIRTLENS